MNYYDIKEISKLLASLEGFEQTGYGQEGIQHIYHDEQGALKEIRFECEAYLQRAELNGCHVWVLGYGERIQRVFLPVSQEVSK